MHVQLGSLILTLNFFALTSFLAKGDLAVLFLSDTSISPLEINPQYDDTDMPTSMSALDYARCWKEFFFI